jgi:Ala-tRNA(Pro) deacylase
VAHTPDSLFAALDALGIAHQTISHPPLFTVEESKALRGTIRGAHTKNLFLKDKKGKLFLVTAVENTQIDLKRLHEVIGGSGRLSFCNPEQLMEHLGVMPGSVTALAVINDTAGRVKLILDARLQAFDPINCHPLVNTMTTSVAWRDLLRFLDSTGHPPDVLTIGEAQTFEVSTSAQDAPATT